MDRFSLSLLFLWGGLALVPIQTLAESPVVVSQREEGQELEVTVYNVGRGLVRDSRRVSLPKGTATLEFRDIAAKVIPETVALEVPEAEVLEQNYEYDLLSPSTLLAKFLGKEVILVREEPRLEGSGTVRREVRATLLALNQGTVWRIGDRIVANPPYLEVIFDQVPKTLRDRPTLVWLLLSAREGQRQIKTTYLTGGLSWKADYVLSLKEDGTEGHLSGWVTLSNESGTAYPNARLQLVAGEVNVVSPRREVGMVEDAMTQAVLLKEAMKREELGEYHLYTLPRPTTILDRQKKQVALLEASGVRVQQKLVVVSNPNWYWSRHDIQHQRVLVRLELANKQANNLGFPLPAGVVRVYQRDSHGSEQFLGEDTIPHTPENETLTMNVGVAFDVVAERVQTDFRSFDHTSESAFEVRLRNHKRHPVTVEVQENIGGDWEILANSHPYLRRSAFVVVFPIAVPAEGEATLAYRVRVRH